MYIHVFITGMYYDSVMLEIQPFHTLHHTTEPTSFAASKSLGMTGLIWTGRHTGRINRDLHVQVIKIQALLGLRRGIEELMWSTLRHSIHDASLDLNDSA